MPVDASITGNSRFSITSLQYLPGSKLWRSPSIVEKKQTIISDQDSID